MSKVDRVHYLKINQEEVKVREYLDECFRTLPYSNPWQTHTKRMLRHKAKIQCAREAFGFGGIYDKDEAERIVEAQVVKENPKADVEMPQTIAPEEVKEIEPRIKRRGSAGS